MVCHAFVWPPFLRFLSLSRFLRSSFQPSIFSFHFFLASFFSPADVSLYVFLFFALLFSFRFAAAFTLSSISPGLMSCRRLRGHAASFAAVFSFR
jgi:hypothetical protein